MAGVKKMVELLWKISDGLDAGRARAQQERKEDGERTRSRRNDDVKGFRGMVGRLEDMRDQLDVVVEMVEANSELAQGVRGAHAHFEREVRGLRTQVVAGVDSMLRSSDVVKREARGGMQMMGRMGEKVEVAVGCLHAEIGGQMGRVEARVGEVEWAVREQWDARHRELVAQVRGLARVVAAAGRSGPGPPQGFVAAAEVEWGIRPGFQFRLGREGLGYYRDTEMVGSRVVDGGGREEMRGREPREGGGGKGKSRVRSEDRREGVQYFAVPLTSK